MDPLFEEKPITCNSTNFNFDYSPKKKLSEQPQDARSNSTSPAAIETKKRTHAPLCKHDDPFLYYSNDDIRLKALKYDGGSDTVCSSKSGDERASRQTRISFELHPDLMMEDLFDELLSDDEDILDMIEYDMDEGSEEDLWTQLVQLKQ